MSSRQNVSRQWAQVRVAIGDKPTKLVLAGDPGQANPDLASSGIKVEKFYHIKVTFKDLIYIKQVLFVLHYIFSVKSHYSITLSLQFIKYSNKICLEHLLFVIGSKQELPTYQKNRKS